MGKIQVHALVMGINLITPCKTRKTLAHLTMVTRKIVSYSEAHFTKAQAVLVIEALRISSEWHAGFYRKDEITPYVVHPFEATLFLFENNIFDFHLTIATILHDSVEDEDSRNKRYAKRKELKKRFGSTVYLVVELITKSRIPYKRKLFFVNIVAEKRLHVLIRAIFAKLADCAKNTETFNVFDEKRQQEKVAEVRKEYPPLLQKLVVSIKKTRLSAKKKKSLLESASNIMAIINYNLTKY
jgi:hypothetical protein